MKRQITASLLAGLALIIGLSTAGADERLEGAWIVASWENLDGNEVEEAQPGMFIFSNKNYVMMYVNTEEERATYDAEAGETDEETLSAYATLTANAGGYSVEGNTLTTYAYVAKDSNYMAGFPENGVEHTFEREDDFMTITGTSGPNPFTVELLRVEDAPGPWESATE